MRRYAAEPAPDRVRYHDCDYGDPERPEFENAIDNGRSVRRGSSGIRTRDRLLMRELR